MNRWSAIAAAAAMAAGGLAVHWQRATGFPGDDLGFGPRPGRVHRVQMPRPARKEPQDTSPSSTSSRRRPITHARLIRYVASFRFVNEKNCLLVRYPRLAYDLVVIGSDGSRSIKKSGLAAVDGNGKATLTCTRLASSEPAYFTFRLVGESRVDPEWQFADPRHVPFALPASTAHGEPGRAGATRIACVAPPIRLRRNFVDIALRGLPPHARVRVGEDAYPVRVQQTLPTVSLPRATAENKDLQMDLSFEDSSIAREALIDAGALLRSGGGNVDAYSLNTLNVPEDEWSLRRADLQGIALQALTPSLGVVDGVGLYSEEQVVGLLGQPEGREASLSFSRPDGAEWLHYPSKGLSVRVRALGGIRGPGARAVELIKLTSPQGGMVGGVAVGAPTQLMLDRFGRGDTDQRLGKPHAGFHSYFAEGVVFNLDAASNVVQSVELWRPLPILALALEPRPMALANRVFLATQPDASPGAVTGDVGQAVAKAFAKGSALLNDRVGSSRSIRRVDAPDKADLAIECRLSRLNAGYQGGVFRGSVSVEVATTKTGGTRTSGTVTATASVGRLEPNATALLARKLYEAVANPICEEIARSFTFMNRVRSIDYRTGDIELDFGSTGTGLVPGVAFDPMNLTWPAFPDPVAIRDLTTPFGPKELEPGIGARIVVVVTSVGPTSATARFAALVRQRGPQGQGFVERVVELQPKDWEPRIKRLIDPATGLLYVRLRPVFYLGPPTEKL